MLGEQEPWIIGALLGAGVGLIVFVVIPTLVRWVWYLDRSDHDTWTDPDE